MSPDLHNTYLYEAVFLIDPAKARQSEKQTGDDLTAIVTRSGGELVNLARWTDRELAYPIRKSHQKFTRAVYFLAHFKAPGPAVDQIERTCHNLDWVIRAIVVRDEDGPGIPGDRPPEPAGQAGPQPAEELPDLDDKSSPEGA